MGFIQTESVLQTKNRYEPAKNRFSVALAVTVRELAPSPYFFLCRYTLLMSMCLQNFDEYPSLRFQDIKDK